MNDELINFQNIFIIIWETMSTVMTRALKEKRIFEKDTCLLFFSIGLMLRG